MAVSALLRAVLEQEKWSRHPVWAGVCTGVVW